MQAVPTVPGWHPVGPATTPAAYWHCAVCPAPTYGAYSVPTLCTLYAHSVHVSSTPGLCHVTPGSIMQRVSRGGPRGTAHCSVHCSQCHQ